MADKKITYQAGDIKITINRAECISCGLCAELAPKTFEMDNKMISVVKSKGPYDTPKKIKEAADSCATSAIKVN